MVKMHKLVLIILFLLLFIFGCEHSNVTESYNIIESKQINGEKQDVKIIIPNRVHMEVYKFEYENHQYIHFYGYKEGCIVHDPDCKCGK